VFAAGERGVHAFVHRDETFTYDELSAMVRDWAALLGASSVAEGSVVALIGVCSPHTGAALAALADRAAIVVPLSPVADLAEEFDTAQVEVVITVGPAGERDLLRTGTVAEHPLYRRLRQAHRPGLVLFSSGTSGAKKASVLDFTTVLARYRHSTGPGNRVLHFLGIDHIGGINTLLHTLSRGGTVVTVADRAPDTVFAAIAAHRVDVLPTTPTFLNLTLVSGAHRRHGIDSLRLITYGTEPMPAHTLRALHADLPTVRLKQTYGLSEVGILPTRSDADDSGWMRLGGAGFAHKIVDGVLWIRSEMAMLGYLNAAAEFDDEGYFNTQDEVETSGESLRVLGRRSEIINVGGEKVYPAEVENAILEVANVSDVLVHGHPSPITGMVVRAVVRITDPEDRRELRRRIRAHCAARLAPFKVPMLISVSAETLHSSRFKKMRR
jgi:acyl-CoA synthetase (AMP-forming)/AMP-acid ligase II